MGRHGKGRRGVSGPEWDSRCQHESGRRKEHKSQHRAHSGPSWQQYDESYSGYEDLDGYSYGFNVKSQYHEHNTGGGMGYEEWEYRHSRLRHSRSRRPSQRAPQPQPGSEGPRFPDEFWEPESAEEPVECEPTKLLEWPYDSFGEGVGETDTSTSSYAFPPTEESTAPRGCACLANHEYDKMLLSYGNSRPDEPDLGHESQEPVCEGPWAAQTGHGPSSNPVIANATNHHASSAPGSCRSNHGLVDPPSSGTHPCYAAPIAVDLRSRSSHESRNSLPHHPANDMHFASRHGGSSDRKSRSKSSEHSSDRRERERSRERARDKDKSGSRREESPRKDRKRTGSRRGSRSGGSSNSSSVTEIKFPDLGITIQNVVYGGNSHYRFVWRKEK